MSYYNHSTSWNTIWKAQVYAKLTVFAIKEIQNTERHHAPRLLETDLVVHKIVQSSDGPDNGWDIKDLYSHGHRSLVTKRPGRIFVHSTHRCKMSKIWACQKTSLQNCGNVFLSQTGGSKRCDRIPGVCRWSWQTWTALICPGWGLATNLKCLVNCWESGVVVMVVY